MKYKAIIKTFSLKRNKFYPNGYVVIQILIDEENKTSIERKVGFKFLEKRYIQVMKENQLLIEIQDLHFYSKDICNEAILSVVHAPQPFNIIGLDLSVAS